MELLKLFKTIDIDHNGKLSREELQLAFSRAGLAVPSSKLDVFFAEVDANRDGSISFEEWRYVHLAQTRAPRSACPNALHAPSLHIHHSKFPHSDSLTQYSDFLLFTPGTSPNLHEVMSYYQATHHINPEGDVLLSDDTIYGLGIHFLHSLFGSIFLVARTPPLSASAFTDVLDSLDMAVPATDAQTLPPRYDAGDLSAAAAAELKSPVPSVASVLIGCFPDIEYFVAGGIAGIGKLPLRCCVRHPGLLCTYA